MGGKVSAVTLAVIAMVFLFGGCATAREYGDAIVSEITSVYDGDTFRCNIDGYSSIVGEDIGVRIGGIDTPEIRGSSPDVKIMALKARDYVAMRLACGKQVQLRGIQRGKYFRVVAEVFIDGKNLGEELLANGMAKPYDGGKKMEW